MRLSARVAMTALVLSAGARAQQPNSDLKLELRCAAPCTFRQGESIWLYLDYTASTPVKYTVLTSQTIAKTLAMNS